MVHELTYALISLNALSNDQKLRLENYYQTARRTVPWASTFALADIKEYLASAVSYSTTFLHHDSHFTLVIYLKIKRLKAFIFTL